LEYKSSSPLSKDSLPEFFFKSFIKRKFNHLDGSHQNVRLLHLICAESSPVGSGIEFHYKLAIKHLFEEKNGK